MKFQPKNFKLLVLATASRMFISLVGLIQIHIVISRYGLTNFGQIAALLSLAPFGTILGASLNWGFRFQVAEMQEDLEIHRSVEDAFKRALKIVVILNFFLLIAFISVPNAFLKAACVTLALSLASVSFVPWIRSLEGTENQPKILLAQSISSILGLLTLIAVGNEATVLLLTSTFMLVGLMTGLISAIIVKLTKNISRSNLAIVGVNGPANTYSNFHTLLLSICGIFLFSLHPLIVYLISGPNESAIYGIHTRVLSFFLGVLSVLSIQMQVGYLKNRSSIQLDSGNVFILLVASLIGGFMYIFMLVVANKLLLSGNVHPLSSLNLSYAVLVMLSIFQIPYAAADLITYGIRWQVFALVRVSSILVIVLFCLSDLRNHLVWIIDFLYIFFYVIPLIMRSRQRL